MGHNWRYDMFDLLTKGELYELAAVLRSGLESTRSEHYFIDMWDSDSSRDMFKDTLAVVEEVTIRHMFQH